MRIAALIVVLFAGCAARRDRRSHGQLDGATYDEVVLRWGAPARSTKLTDGRDVYTWVSDGTYPGGASTRRSEFPAAAVAE